MQDGLVSVKSDYTESVGSSDSAFQVVKVWSHIMQGSSPWSFIRMVGDALVIYGDGGAH